MNEYMHGLTVVCFCVCVCVCVCGWVVRSTCLQGGAVYIYHGGQGTSTFTNCNFTLNSASSVSLEEDHVDDCEMSKCMTLRLCPPCISSLLTHPCFLYRFNVIVSRDRRSVLISLISLLRCCSSYYSLPLRVHL